MSFGHLLVLKTVLKAADHQVSMSENSANGSRGRSGSVVSLNSEPVTPASPRSSAQSSRSSSCSSRPKIYSCDYEGCDKIYSRPSLLTQHQRTHTDSRPFVCTECDRGFFREDHLKRHTLSHTGEKPFICTTCGKGVNTKQHLKRHEITHTKSFKCDYEGCDESFYKHQQLRHHKQSVHLKTLTCDECGKTFPRPYRLANHKAKHHGAAPAYQCDFTGCLLSFKTWSALQLHMKTDHPRLKCEACGKPCVGEEGLRMHMLVHDDAKALKLWKCPECPLDFQKKDELIIHCKNQHNFIPASIRQMANDTKEKKILSTEKVEALFEKKNSALDLLLNSVKAPEVRIPCTYKNCRRDFAKEFDLKRHLLWHDKQREKSSVDLGNKEEIDMALKLTN